MTDCRRGQPQPISPRWTSAVKTNDDAADAVRRESYGDDDGDAGDEVQRGEPEPLVVVGLVQGPQQGGVQGKEIFPVGALDDALRRAAHEAALEELRLGEDRTKTKYRGGPPQPVSPRWTSSVKTNDDAADAEKFRSAADIRRESYDTAFSRGPEPRQSRVRSPFARSPHRPKTKRNDEPQGFSSDGAAVVPQAQGFCFSADIDHGQPDSQRDGVVQHTTQDTTEMAGIAANLRRPSSSTDAGAGPGSYDPTSHAHTHGTTTDDDAHRDDRDVSPEPARTSAAPGSFIGVRHHRRDRSPQALLAAARGTADAEDVADAEHFGFDDEPHDGRSPGADAGDYTQWRDGAAVAAAANPEDDFTSSPLHHHQKELRSPMTFDSAAPAPFRSPRRTANMTGQDRVPSPMTAARGAAPKPAFDASPAGLARARTPEKRSGETPSSAVWREERERRASDLERKRRAIMATKEQARRRRERQAEDLLRQKAAQVRAARDFSQSLTGPRCGSPAD